METMVGCVKKSTLDARTRERTESRRRTGRKLASKDVEKGRRTDVGVIADIVYGYGEPSKSIFLKSVKVEVIDHSLRVSH